MFMVGNSIGVEIGWLVLTIKIIFSNSTTRLLLPTSFAPEAEKHDDEEDTLAIDLFTDADYVVTVTNTEVLFEYVGPDQK